MNPRSTIRSLEKYSFWIENKLNMDNKSRGKIIMDDFLTIMNRIKEPTGIKNPTQLSKIIDIPQATISRRKKANQFEIEWAYLISIQFDLPMEWILTGREKTRGNIKRDFLLKLEEWIEEMTKKDPRKADWFELEIEKTFPEFRMWLQRKNGAEGRNTSISKVA